MNRIPNNRNLVRWDNRPKYIPDECPACGTRLVPYERDRHDRFACIPCGLVFSDWPPKTRRYRR